MRDHTGCSAPEFINNKHIIIFSRDRAYYKSIFIQINPCPTEKIYMMHQLLKNQLM